MLVLVDDESLRGRHESLASASIERTGWKHCHYPWLGELDEGTISEEMNGDEGRRWGGDHLRIRSG
jgi:hypothetical protein